MCFLRFSDCIGSLILLRTVLSKEGYVQLEYHELNRAGHKHTHADKGLKLRVKGALALWQNNGKARNGDGHAMTNKEGERYAKLWQLVGWPSKFSF